MGYATKSDLITRFGDDELTQLTDRVGAGAADAAAVARALTDAEAEIDGYLAARYRLPLASVPPLLTRLACDLARYRLWSDLASEEVRRRYEDARRLLESLASGRVTLGVLPPPDALGAGTMSLAPARPRDWGPLQ